MYIKCNLNVRETAIKAIAGYENSLMIHFIRKIVYDLLRGVKNEEFYTL